MPDRVPCRLPVLSRSLADLFGWCVRHQRSMSPYGLNPHFLPSSSLFDPTATNMSLLQNSSLVDKLELNPNGIPYGFFPPEVLLGAVRGGRQAALPGLHARMTAQ